MSLLPVVESPDVAEDRFSQLCSYVPAFSVEQMGLHAPPERFHGSVVVSIMDASHEEYDPCYFYASAESVGNELASVIRVNDPCHRCVVLNRHIDGVGDSELIL